MMTNDLLGMSMEMPTESGGAYKVVSVRMRAAEYASFSKVAQAAGLTNNMAMRVAARRIAGFLEIDVATRQDMQAVSGRIGQIADALTEISRIATSKGVVDVERVAQLRQDFGKDFATLDGLLRVILNVSRRRIDGTAMLETAARR